MTPFPFLMKSPGKVGELVRFLEKIQAAANRLVAVLADILPTGAGS
ncbi:MAG: hypothetical protein AAB676_21215 [Verrucomicrobiota bacterium]